MKVDWGNTTSSYVYTRSFLAINQEYKAIGSPSACKDFLTDRYAGAFTGKGIGGYSTVYDPETMPRTDLEKARAIYTGGNVEKTVDLLHQVEDHYGIPHSTFEKIENPLKNCKLEMVYWEGDKTYTIAPPLFGFWCLLIRDKYHEIGTNWRETTDSSERYLKLSVPAMDFVFAEGPTKVFGDDQTLNWTIIGTHTQQHSYVGPVAYATGNTNKFFPHWKPFTLEVEEFPW